MQVGKNEKMHHMMLMKEKDNQKNPLQMFAGSSVGLKIF